MNADLLKQESASVRAPNLQSKAIRLMKIAITTLVLFILIYYTALSLFQRRLIFPGTIIEARTFLAPRGTETLTVAHEDGTTNGYLTLGAGVTPDRPAPLVVYAHGNFEVADDFPFHAEPYTELGLNLLVIEYRGYGHADGKPTRANIDADAMALIDEAGKHPAVDTRQLIFHGRSLGGAVVGSVAEQRRPRAIILESTFTSLADMGRRFLAPPFLVRDRYNTRRFLETYDGPVLIVHGTDDHIIPIANSTRNQTAALGAGANGPDRVTLHHYDMTHNDPWPAEFLQDIKEFLLQHDLGSVPSTE